MAFFFKSKKGLPSEKTSWDVNYDDLQFGEEIGKGNYGQVIRGTYFGTDVAIKHIKDENKKYLEREVKLLKDVRHPNLVQLMGVCEHKTGLYLVTEYLTGGHLRRKLKTKTIDIPWWLRVKVALDVSVAVQYLHSKDIIHRDLKSKNLLLDEHWRVKLCDFGLARTVPKDSNGNGRRMTVCGTEEWIAPEVALGKPYGMPADVFSYGMILWELIMREKPNENAIQKSTLSGVDYGVARTFIPPDAPLGFVDIAIRTTGYDPSTRPTMAEVTKELKVIMAANPIPPSIAATRKLTYSELSLGESSSSLTEA